MDVQWLPCVRYEGVYLVSSEGRIKRVGGDFLSVARTDMYGHPIVNLKDSGRSNVMRVCKIVAMTFLGATAKQFIFHKNGDITDCSVENLEVFNSKHDAPIELTHDFVMKSVKYDPETGEFFRIPPENTRGFVRPREPYPFGCFKLYNGKKYLQITLGKHQVLGHRLAFFMVNGRWPEEIDHIDGDGSNNRLENLREVTHEENCRNVRYSRDVAGYHLEKKSGKWVAYAGDLRERCDTEEQAIEARKRLVVQAGFHENHGKRKVP